MPFLAAYPIVDEPEDTFDPFADSRTFSFRSLDGEALLPFTGAEFIARWGIQGLDVPPRDLVEDEVPGQDGSDLVDIHIGGRDWFIPIWVGSDSGHLQYLQNRARMRSFFNHRSVDYRRAGGTFDLVATSVLGERSLRSTYVDGMGGEWAQDTAGNYWESFGLKARSVRPYWQGERWSTPIIRKPTGARWFGRFPGQLGSSRALGADIPVTVLGDSQSWPRINLMGPASAVTIIGPGLYVSIPDGLGEGEQAVIETDPALRVNQGALFGGETDWSRVAPLTRWAPMQPGARLMTIDLGDATADSYAFVDGASNWESPW